jgi:diketogulonate reductase-like aldo/keto reductase
MSGGRDQQDGGAPGGEQRREVSQTLELGELGEAGRQRSCQQERKEHLDAGLHYAHFLQQLDEISVTPLEFGLVADRAVASHSRSNVDAHAARVPVRGNGRTATTRVGVRGVGPVTALRAGAQRGRRRARQPEITGATLGALTDLVRQAKVRYIGSSSYSGSEIVDAQWTARDRGLERFRTEQPPYSILTRLDVLPTAQRHGMGILTYSPLGGGWLSGRYGKDANASPASSARARGALAARFGMSLPENQRKLEAVEQLPQVADDAGLTLIELAIAFVLNHPGVTSAIIGPRTMEQLESQLPAADIVLDPATLDRIDGIVKPGVVINPADTSYGAQVLQPTLRRR